MTTGIALLLKGSGADLSATLHAIELAKRTTGLVHAVFVGKRLAKERNAASDQAGGYERAGGVIKLLRWLGDVEQVNVHIHMVESLTDDLLVRFCCTYRIFCLVLGAADRNAMARKAVWFNRLQRRLSGERAWFLPVPWSVIIEPWGKPVFEQVINRLKKGTGSTAAVSNLTGSLRHGLSEFDGTETN